MGCSRACARDQAGRGRVAGGRQAHRGPAAEQNPFVAGQVADVQVAPTRKRLLYPVSVAQSAPRAPGCTPRLGVLEDFALGRR